MADEFFAKLVGCVQAVVFSLPWWLRVIIALALVRYFKGEF